MLKRREWDEYANSEIAYRPDSCIGQKRCAEQDIRGTHGLLTNEMTFGLIGVEEVLRGLSMQHQGQFPRQIVRILHTGIESLTTGRAMDMGGISGEKHSSYPVTGNLAQLRRPTSKPARLA